MNLPFLRCGLFFLLTSVLPCMASTNFSSVGENLFAKAGDLTATGGAVSNSGGTLTLQTNSAAGASFQRAFSVEPNTEYFFAVDVLSPDRVVATMGGLNMSYHRQGTWQTVCGLVRPNVKGQLDLKLALRSLTSGQAAQAEIKNLRLQRVERPQRVVSRPRDGSTTLLQDGAAKATIIYPSTTKDGKTQGEAIRSAIEAQSGINLPLLSDVEATDEKAPILHPNLREQNLIIIGRLATNRALWSAYNRFLAAEDGYYPGGEGFVVRTAADVFRNGKNHLILGGSTEVGVQKAVDHFIKTASSTDTAKRQTIQLPWLLDVELGGECLAAFQADEKVWQDPENPLLAAMTPGYGKVVRWYQNAMGYYWSDLPEYRQRAQDYLKQVLTDRSHTHQYIVEFFIRTVEMLDESPFFTKSEIEQIDSLVLENFLNFLTVTDLSWMTTFSPPYQAIGIVNRHQIAPWYSDLKMAEFLARHVELGGELKELVEFRLSEKDAAFRAFVSTRNGPSMPGIAGSSDYGEFPAVFYRYALENDLYHEFFDSGLARQALSLERLDQTTATYAYPGSHVDIPDWLGTLSHLTHDGTYRWLLDNIAYPKPERGPFQGRYVADVHRYHIGQDLPPVAPDPSWAGIKIVAQPEIADQTDAITKSQFPLVSIRGGFTPTDDFLAILGVNPSLPAGVLVKMVLGGQSIFNASDEAGSRVTTNGASAINLSDYNPEREKQVPQISAIRWKAELPGAWALQTETPIAADIIWRRDIVRLSSELYAFADTFIAQRDARYLLRVAWHGTTPLTPDQGRWKVTTNKGSTNISPVGDGFLPRVDGNSLFFESTRSMKSGEAVTAWTVVQRTSVKDPLWAASLRSPAQLQLQQGTGNTTLLHRGALETSAGTLTSDLQVETSEGLAVFGWQESPSAAFQSFSWPTNAAQTDAAPLSETWLPAVKEALANTAPSSTTLPVDAVTPSPIVNDLAPWRQAWSYDGLLRPTRIQPAIKDGIVDFGQVVSLAEIRSATTQYRIWNTTTVPTDIMSATGDSATAPAPDSPSWTPVTGELKDRPGIRSGNYGEMHPLPQVDQSLFPKDLHTRFLRSANTAQLRFYVNDSLKARHPIRVRTIRDAGPTPLIIANTNIFPAFPRMIRDDDFALSVLRPDGKTQASLDIAGPVQSFLVADQSGAGQPQILILKANGRLDAFSLTGQPIFSKDLFEDLVKFDKTYGNPNTRQPTGGHRMPFSFGLWRKDKKGASKVVIGRYGNFSFLDEKLNFEGVLIGGPYGNSGVIPKGYDFNGDGKDETLAIERFNLTQIGGENKPVVRNPQAANTWPEVYQVESQKFAKDADTQLLAGAPIYEFRVLEQYGGNPRFVFVARGNYIGIYDARDKQWVFSWAPPAPIQAAALVKETPDKIQACVATMDGIVWSLTWDVRRPGRPVIDIQPVGLNIADITAPPSQDGSALLSAREGLYLRSSDGKISRIAEGGFQSADFVTDSTGKRQIAAATLLGQILSYQETTAP